MPGASNHGEISPASPLGVFDSGLGGLSIVRELSRQLPRERIVYFADNQHMPYGPRPLAEVRNFCVAIAGKLIEIPVKLIVVACNTASAASLRHLRLAFPDMPFVGMEPAVKPAAAGTVSGKVGVLATQATFHGELFESVVERFAANVEIIRQPCPGLAEFIERHPPDHPALKPMLERFIHPLLAKGVDRLVLACTHYPLVKDAIVETAGNGVTVIDPSPAIARRARQLLEERNMLAAEGDGGMAFYASGDADAFSASASQILARDIRAEKDAFNWLPAPDSGSAVIWGMDK